MIQVRFPAILLICIIFGVGFSERLSAESIEKYYPEEKNRLYYFVMNDSTIGKLEIEYGGKSRFEGIRAYRIHEQLTLDFSPLGQNYQLSVDNRHYINGENIYVGDEMTMTVNNQSQQLFFHNDQAVLNGYSIINGSKQTLNLPPGGDFPSMNANMIDQIELWLVARDIDIGGEFVDTVFIPQTLLMAPVAMKVTNFRWIRYGTLYDSAFVCEFNDPIQMTVYYSKDRRVIRLDQTGQNLNIYLHETPFEKMAPVKQTSAPTDILKRIPLYLFYLAGAGIFSVFYIRRVYARYEIYIAAVLGAVIIAIIYPQLLNIQRWYSTEYLLPGMKGGSSIYVLAILPSVFSSFFIELAKLIPIVFLFIWRSPVPRLMITVGFFAGLGLGVYEAGLLTGPAFQAGTMNLIARGTIERLVMILFHGATGALLGYALAFGWLRLLLFWFSILAVHLFSEYLIVFIQTKLLDIPLLIVARAIITLLIVLGVYFLSKAIRR